MNAAIQVPTRVSSVDLFAGLDPYRFFAACFGQPSPNRFVWISGREFRALIKRMADEVEGGRPSARLGCFPDYAAYEAAYLALFEVGVPQPPVPLLESAHCHRAVPQEIVLECVNFYEVLELRPSGSAFPADHLVTQLEFLAAVCYLRESKSGEEEVAALRQLELDFLERHLLSWLPTAQKRLAKLDPPLFSSLLGLVCLYARDRLDSSPQPKMSS